MMIWIYLFGIIALGLTAATFVENWNDVGMWVFILVVLWPVIVVVAIVSFAWPLPGHIISKIKEPDRE